jgi:nitroreductase
MFNDLSSPASLLATRRSGKARDMVAPGPDSAQLAAIVTAAMRVPDHGKLAPWRLVIIGADQRDAFAGLLTTAYCKEKPAAGRLELEAMDAFARQAPTMIALLSTPIGASKIPLWEQQLSAGALAMQLLNAAHAAGFVGNWLTGWPANSADVAAALGATGPDDRIIGYVFIGTPARELEERPRPDFAQVVSYWSA